MYRGAEALRESREWWAIDDDGECVRKVTGYSCAPNNPGYWWVPSLGSSMSEDFRLFKTEAEALDKHIGNLEQLATKTSQRIVACWLQRSRLGTYHYSPPTREEKFVAGLDKSIAFHRSNTNDPHGIGNAVLCSLIETRNAFAEACGLPKAK